MVTTMTVGRPGSAVPSVEELAKEALSRRKEYRGDSVVASVWGVMISHGLEFSNLYACILECAQALERNSSRETEKAPPPAPPPTSWSQEWERKQEDNAIVLEIFEHQPPGQMSLPGF